MNQIGLRVIEWLLSNPQFGCAWARSHNHGNELSKGMHNTFGPLPDDALTCIPLCLLWRVEDARVLQWAPGIEIRKRAVCVQRNYGDGVAGHNASVPMNHQMCPLMGARTQLIPLLAPLHHCLQVVQGRRVFHDPNAVDEKEC